VIEFQTHFLFQCSKVRLKSAYLATSESEFDQANRSLRLKVSVLVYTVSRLSKFKAIYRSLHESFCCCEIICKNFLSFKTVREDTSDAPETPCIFLTATICSCDGVLIFVSASNLNHMNTQSIVNMFPTGILMIWLYRTSTPLRTIAPLI